MKKDEKKSANVNEGAKLKGVYTITIAQLQTKAQKDLDKKIRRYRSMGRDVSQLVRLLNKSCKTRKIVVENIIPTAGRTAIAQHLTNASPSPSTLLVNYFGLGSGTTAPANGDTTLETEVFRNAVASRTNANNIAYITGFFASTDTSGTYREVGLFINGTGTANTGTLLSRVAVNITKTSVQTLTVDYTITIS